MATDQVSAENPETILRFWFGDKPEQSIFDKTFSRLWWSKDDIIDSEIRTRFEPWVQDAASGKLQKWEDSSSGMLALILLTDQFPRNIYRGTSQSFAHDHLALSWCLGGIARSKDIELIPIQRLFWYMPLEHSELLEHQDQCVGLIEQLVSEADDHQRSIYLDFLAYAQRHRDVINRFGRFPHRNAILGRTSTPAEEMFLQMPGSGF